MVQETENQFKKPEPRWQRKKEARPQEILTAALELFVKQGFSATKVSQVAKKAGVTPGTLYVYFENKDAILKAVVKMALDPIFEFGDNFLENYSGTPEELVHILVHKWWELMESEHVAGIPKLMTAEANNFPELADFYYKEVLSFAFDYIRRILRYGIERGKFQVTDVDLEAHIIMSSLHGATVDAHSFALVQKEGFDMNLYLDSLTSLILGGIAKK